MNESPEKPTEMPKAKVGADGLTKYQRYYQRHPEVRIKNRERERLRRERRRKECARAKENNNATPQLPQNFPSDFHITAEPDLECWSYPLLRNWDSEGDANDPSANTKNDLDELFEVRKEIYEWGKGWGGVNNWKFSLDYSFGEAVAGNRVDSWKDQLDQHTDTGRNILNKLRAMDRVLPKEDWKLRQFWRQRLEFVEVLIQGITILDMKTSILPGLCNIENTFEKGDVTMDTVFDDDPVFQLTDGDDDEDSDSDGSYRPPQG